MTYPNDRLPAPLMSRGPWAWLLAALAVSGGIWASGSLVVALFAAAVMATVILAAGIDRR